MAILLSISSDWHCSETSLTLITSFKTCFTLTLFNKHQNITEQYSVAYLLSERHSITADLTDDRAKVYTETYFKKFEKLLRPHMTSGEILIIRDVLIKH